VSLTKHINDRIFMAALRFVIPGDENGEADIPTLGCYLANHHMELLFDHDQSL